MPLAGYINAAAAGHGVSVFGLFSIPPLTRENGRLSQAAIGVHLIGRYFVYLFVSLHIVGALLHGAVNVTACWNACCRCVAPNRNLVANRLF
jgi:cytochrome b561